MVFTSIFFLQCFIFIEIQLTYNTVLVLGVQHNDICLYCSRFSFIPTIKPFVVSVWEMRMEREYGSSTQKTALSAKAFFFFLLFFFLNSITSHFFRKSESQSSAYFCMLEPK